MSIIKSNQTKVSNNESGPKYLLSIALLSNGLFCICLSTTKETIYGMSFDERLLLKF